MALLLVAALALSACGGGGTGVSAPAGRVLAARVHAIRYAATGADRRAATQALAQLRTSVNQLKSNGRLSRTAAERIRHAADAVQSQLALLPTPTTTTTTTTTTTLPTPPDRPGPKDNHGHGNKDKRGEGEGPD